MINENLISNMTEFLKMIMRELDPKAAKFCTTMLSSFFDSELKPSGNISSMSSSYILNILGTGANQIPISAIFKPNELKELSAESSVNLIREVGNNLDKESALSLGLNVPSNTSLTQVKQAICCIPKEIIENASPTDIANSLATMNLELVNNERKIKLVKKVKIFFNEI
jgi:hypothetical protein